ncbi:hypothetical protein WAE61_17340 [Comamonadaceae bacterium PP-2]
MEHTKRQLRPAQPATPEDPDQGSHSAEALLAGTLALMTGHAQADGRPAEQQMIAAKIIDNLLRLSAHPTLSTPFCAMVHKLQHDWFVLMAEDRPAVGHASGERQRPAVPWVDAPDALQ